MGGPESESNIQPPNDGVDLRKQFLNLKETAEVLGCDVSKVPDLVGSCEIHGFRLKPGGEFYIETHSVQNMMNRSRRGVR